MAEKWTVPDNLDLAELDRLEREATPGSWTWDRDGYDSLCCVRTSDGTAHMGVSGGPQYSEEQDKQDDTDAAFIAAARNAVRPLLDRLAQAEQSNAEFTRLTRAAMKVWVEDETEAQHALHAALHDLEQHAKGCGWTDTPEPMTKQLVERLEQAEADRTCHRQAARESQVQLDAAKEEVKRLKAAILAFGNNPAGFDWAVLAKLDELKQENERLRTVLKLFADMFHSDSTVVTKAHGSIPAVTTPAQWFADKAKEAIGE
jgi:hypothetical protein